MINDDIAYFGSETQQALQRRSEQFWTIVKDDPRMACHGRAVALVTPGMDQFNKIVAMARLIGVCPLEGISQSMTDALKPRLAEAGLVTDEYALWAGEAGSIAAARALLAERSLPADLQVLQTGPDTPAEDLRKLDALTQACEVLLPMASFLRGEQQPSVFVYAKDPAGQVVGAAAAVASGHKDHPRGGEVWWGMLSTDAARRGEGIALLLGAMALDQINAKFGYTACMTGIREGNAPSEALCRKLGLAPNGERNLIVIDPAAFASGRVTK